MRVTPPPAVLLGLALRWMAPLGTPLPPGLAAGSAVSDAPTAPADDPLPAELAALRDRAVQLMAALTSTVSGGAFLNGYPAPPRKAVLQRWRTRPASAALLHSLLAIVAAPPQRGVDDTDDEDGADGGDGDGGGDEGSQGSPPAGGLPMLISGSTP